MAEQLTEDVLVEILCRLAPKTLIGLKCVCKSWNTLISNVCVPRISSTPVSGFLFRSGWLHGSERFTDYISYSDDDENLSNGNGNVNSNSNGFVKSLFTLLPSENSPYELFDCCKGLILFGSRIIPKYYVCNPTTRQCIAIPKPSVHVDTLSAALAFDPCTSPHYKIVRFLHKPSLPDPTPPDPPMLDIFSSDTGKWIRRKVPVEPHIASRTYWTKRTVYLDGMLYLVTLSKHLLRFDIKAVTNTALAIKLPDYNTIYVWGFIGVSKRRLHYANQDGYRMLIWLLDDHPKDDQSWTLKHSFCIYDLSTKHPAAQVLSLHRECPYFNPYAIHPTSDIIFLGIPRMLLSYNLETNRMEVLCRRQANQVIVMGQYNVFHYSKCFIILNDFN